MVAIERGKTKPVFVEMIRKRVLDFVNKFTEGVVHKDIDGNLKALKIEQERVNTGATSEVRRYVKGLPVFLDRDV